MLSGDFNGDGVVDARNYVVWRKTNGAASDYGLWRGNFGQVAGSGSGASAAVPETSSLALLLMGFVATCCCRRAGVS